MQLFAYIKGLFHRITKGQIKASCDAVAESLQKHTLPGYTAASDFFREHKLASKEAKEAIQTFNKTVGAPKGGNTIVDAIKDALDNTVVLMGQIGSKTDTLFADTESTLGMTFQKAMYLRLISVATFADEFARKFLNYLYIVETAQQDPNGSPIKEAMSPAEREWVEANFGNFCLVLRVLSQDCRDVIKQVDELPDALVSEQSETTLAASNGFKKVDPFGFRDVMQPLTVKTTWNPFHLLGTIVADWRAANYKTAKEELDLIQMRKLNLEKLHAKQPDARLQQQIEYLGKRVSKLNFELQEMEKKYG